MIIKKIENIEAFEGNEGTKIKQIISPGEANNAIRYSIAHCTISSGKNSKPHTMKTSEVYYILQGHGIMHIDSETKQVNQNEMIFVPPMSKQYLENNGKIDLVVLCIVDPAWRQEDEILD